MSRCFTFYRNLCLAYPKDIFLLNFILQTVSLNDGPGHDHDGDSLENIILLVIGHDGLFHLVGDGVETRDLNSGPLLEPIDDEEGDVVPDPNDVFRATGSFQENPVPMVNFLEKPFLLQVLDPERESVSTEEFFGCFPFRQSPSHGSSPVLRQAPLVIFQTNYF